MDKNEVYVVDVRALVKAHDGGCFSNFDSKVLSEYPDHTRFGTVYNALSSHQVQYIISLVENVFTGLSGMRDRVRDAAKCREFECPSCETSHVIGDVQAVREVVPYTLMRVILLSMLEQLDNDYKPAWRKNSEVVQELNLGEPSTNEDDSYGTALDELRGRTATEENPALVKLLEELKAQREQGRVSDVNDQLKGVVEAAVRLYHAS